MYLKRLRTVENKNRQYEMIVWIPLAMCNEIENGKLSDR